MDEHCRFSGFYKIYGNITLVTVVGNIEDFNYKISHKLSHILSEQVQ